MTFFDDRIQNTSEDEVRAQVIANAQGAGLDTTNWRIVSVAVQILESCVGALFTFMTVVPAYIRGFASLDTSTDPGDIDAFDSNNVNLSPSFGFLSAFGQNTFGTTREGETFATGFATFVNAGPGSRVISPGGLIYTWTGGSPPSPAPTYVNSPDPTIYTGGGGTLTVPANTTVTIPISAQIAGASSSAPSSVLTLTTSLIGCSGTNPTPVIGNDREDRQTYIDRCRQAVARISLGGPSAAYAYLAAKNLDGTPLLNDAAPPVPTGITRVQVTQDSTTGIVNAYYASASGGAIADDVSAANRNILTEAFATPDAITFTGIAATPVTIHVQGTAKIKARAGVTAALVAQGIVTSLLRNGQQIPIGGVDQVSGSGVVYTRDLEAFGREGFDGVYDLIVTLPAGATTALSVGEVPVITSVAGDGLGSADWTIAVVA